MAAWVDEIGREAAENSLVYSFYGVLEEQVTSVMDDVLETLNQNSILVELETTESLYYSRKELIQHGLELVFNPTVDVK